VDRTYISALERSVYNASITMVAKLATILEVEHAALPSPMKRAARKRPFREAY
jgi:hypothetical protein